MDHSPSQLQLRIKSKKKEDVGLLMGKQNIFIHVQIFVFVVTSFLIPNI